MKSIHDKGECTLAAEQDNKRFTNVTVDTNPYGNDRPTGCSWHDNFGKTYGNVELWKSSSGNCTVNGYAGCFCKKVSGERYTNYNSAH